MITDVQLRLSNAQAITTGTQVSTNVIDLKSPNTNIGVGANRRIFSAVDTTLTGGTSVAVQVIQSAAENMSSPDILLTGPVVLEAAAVKGKVLLDAILPNNTKRYIAVQYVNVDTHGAGSVTTNVVADADHNPYPPANTGR